LGKLQQADKMNISKGYLDNPSFESTGESFRYCFDRAAQNAFKDAANTAGNVAGEAGSNMRNERGALTPFYRQEMNAQHAFSPEQTNELLNYAGAGAGGAAATSAGQLASQAARTRNTAGLSSALDENARNRMRTMSEANLGVGAQDIMGAKALNQEGAAGLQGLEGNDQNAQLRAMGLQTGDISGRVEAGKSGWFQNTLAAITAITGGKGLSGGMNKIPGFGG
jgi:hypothetical protein